MKKTTLALLIGTCALGASAPAMAGTPASAAKLHLTTSPNGKSKAMSAIQSAIAKGNAHAFKGLSNAAHHVPGSNASNGC